MAFQYYPLINQSNNNKFIFDINIFKSINILKAYHNKPLHRLPSITTFLYKKSTVTILKFWFSVFPWPHEFNSSLICYHHRSTIVAVILNQLNYSAGN